MRYMVLVEDDPLQVQDYRLQLESAFPGVKLECLETESQFYGWLASHAETGPVPDVFVIDIMLRWTDPDADMRLPPDDVKFEGIYRAGFRCARRLAATHRMRAVPIVLYSVLEKGDVEQELAAHASVTFLWKGSPETLAEKLHAILQSR